MLEAVPVFQWIGQDENGNAWWQLVGVLDLDENQEENNGTDVCNDRDTGAGHPRG